MTITLAHTKGGVGKTSSAVALCIAAHARGIGVELLDADRQASAARWADVAEQRGEPLPFPVRRAEAKTIERRRERRGYGPALTVIDTPPGTASEIQAGIDAADLVIIPSGASMLDIDRVWPTLEVTRHKPAVILLTGVLLNAVLYEDARALFDDEGVPVFRTPIPQREKIKGWFGSVPDNLHGYTDILDEIEGITDDLEVSL